MGDSESFVGKNWNGLKDFWSDRLSFFENYTRFTKRDAPLPSWSSSDVEEFIASDPVHGPTVISFYLSLALSYVWYSLCICGHPIQLKTAREAVTFGVTGAALGAVSTAAFAWKYSRSPHGAALSFLGGGVFGWTFGQEVANHTLQLYKLDTMAAQVKFMEWWERKSQ
ncbi:SDH6 [Arabidopsis thaliana]|uniref:SDH6 n=1 Tax=Arabidopsis thaliana TaxID=3702 RepID=A0A178WBH0_ARATH|nr:SDH6 [Arabidopsis thaliana]